MLRITKIYGGNEKEVLEKKHNIFIAISLGNKWFNKENLQEYIKWALKNTKKKVLIWIVDKIHAVNYEIKDNKSPETSIKMALKEGDKKLNILKEIIPNLTKKESKIIEIVRHADLENLEHYKKLKKYFYQKFKSDIKFREAILEIVKNVFSLKFDEQKVERLSEYALNEFPILLSSFKYKGIEYSCYPYPKHTRISEFIEKIQNKEVFPEIVDNFKFKSVVCVQLEGNK